MNVKKYIYAFMALVAVATLAAAVPAFAQTTTSMPISGAWSGRMLGAKGNKPMMKPGVFGTVSAVSGNIITVNGKQGFGANTVATTYTVDATNAKIMKNNAASTISGIVVGDTIVAQGTLTGNNLVATMIRDGQANMVRGDQGKGKMMNKSGQELSTIVGNGQPVVAGTVSSVNGSTVIITNKSNVTYTVDATNAKITQGPSVITASSLVAGDMVVVQGTVNGNAIIASTIIDQTRPANTNTTAGESHGGFFSGVGSFFAHLFGY